MKRSNRGGQGREARGGSETSRTQGEKYDRSDDLCQNDAALAGRVSGAATGHSRASAAGAQAGTIPVRWATLEWSGHFRRVHPHRIFRHDRAHYSCDRAAQASRAAGTRRVSEADPRQIQLREEFAEFLGAQGSERFLAALSAQTPGPRYRVLRGMRGGIILAVVGIGFLVLTGLRHGFVVPGVLFLALGAGLLMSAAASYHFSKKWGDGGPATPGQPLSQS